MAIQPLALQIGTQNPVGNALTQIGQTITDVQQQRRQNALLDLAEKRDARQATLQDAALKQKQDQVAFERTKAQAPVIARLLDGVGDQASWDAALASAGSLGLDTSKVPKQYDPAVVDGYKQITAALMDPEKRYKSVGDVLYDLQGKGGPAAVARNPKPVSLAPGGSLVDPVTGKPIFTAPDRPDRTLVAIPDATSPTGFRNVPRDQAVNQPAMGPSGLSMEFGADGKPTRIISGPGAGKPGAAGPLQKGTVQKIEEKQLNLTDTQARLAQIEQSFNPEFLQLGPRLGMAGKSMREFVGAKLDPADQKSLADFTAFRRDATTNLNATIKDITGSAMGVDEAKRIIATLPNAGQGVFDGDSPTQFQTKLQGALRDTRNAIMRYSYAKANGLDPLKTGIELSDVPALVEKRGKEIEGQVRAQMPNLRPDQLRLEVRSRLAGEFGMK